MRWSVLGRNNRKRKFRDRTHPPAPKVKKLTRHKFLCQLQTRLRHHHQTYKFYILSLFINRQQLAMFRSLNQWEKPNKSVNGKLWDCSIQYLHLRGVSTMSGEHILNLFQRWSLSYKYPKFLLDYFRLRHRVGYNRMEAVKPRYWEQNGLSNLVLEYGSLFCKVE